jgi:hypothetical protein
MTGRPAPAGVAAARRWAGSVRDRLVAPVAAQDLRLALAIGRMEARAVRTAVYPDLADAEFRVFSQWGEDGIIQYLISRVAIGRPAFVEFGVEDYRESNTRFLLQNDHWEGLIIDGGTAHLDFLAEGDLRWRYTIEGRSAFLTRDNVNQVIRAGGMVGDIGLLSVDVDGNDYWILEALDVVSPRILIVEYNSLFGGEAAVTVPYRPDFERRAAHWSSVYYGASLAAIDDLAAAKGFRLVGCNRAGVNAFFVRTDVVGDLPVKTPEAAYVRRHHRESRDRDGNLTYLGDPAAQLALMADQPLVDVRSGRTGTVQELVAG